ncbi:MAG: MBL fold metallo-hydrolase [Bacteriovoracaceae bacterium]|nr:MBL fold metallo-hydrolase [Bacteriovoracaceae bacterium]
MIFKQLFDQNTWTYTYLIADAKTREGIIIDPVYEQEQRDLKLINELQIDLKYIFETHVHADHITSAANLSSKTKAQKVVGKDTKVYCADIALEDGEVLRFGSLKIKGIATPGHTSGCMSYLVEDMVFTGDTLFIRGNGRTDFQGGSPQKLYHSITYKLFALPDETIVYPGHDYKGMTSSTIWEEKLLNPKVNVDVTVSDFVDTMAGLSLPHPKMINIALPANQMCGNV